MLWVLKRIVFLLSRALKHDLPLPTYTKFVADYLQNVEAKFGQKIIIIKIIIENIVTKEEIANHICVFKRHLYV